MTKTIPPRSDLPSFIGSWPRLEGNQEPAIESRQPGDESEGDRCAQFGFNLANEYGVKTQCMPWQWSNLTGILSVKPPNEWGERKWTHRDVCIEATRQQGKTLVVVLLILFHLFVAPCVGRARPLKIVYTAQRWSTAKDVFDRTVRIINRVPSLKRRLAVDRNGNPKKPSTRDNHGLIEVVVKRGRERDRSDDIVATCEFAPRSQEFGRGVTELDILFIDEAYDVDPGIENDLTGAQSASNNAQTIYLSTSPVFLKHPKCQSLSDLHRMGHRTGESKPRHLFYRLFAAPAHLERDDPQAWRVAQPSFGIATNDVEIESKLDKAKTVVKRMIFDADYLGRGEYAPPELEDETEIPAEGWVTLKADGAPEFVGTPVVVLERQGNGPWVMTAAWRTKAGPVLVEVGYCEAASSKVVAQRVATVVHEWGPAAFVIRSGSAAAEVIPDLETADVEVYTASRIEFAQACGGFLLAATATTQELMHGDQAELNNGVGAAVKKKLPAGGFVWDLVDTASYPALAGASLAHWALTMFSPPPKKPPARPQGGKRRTSVRRESDVMEMAF